jgi:hypothetical protein
MAWDAFSLFSSSFGFYVKLRSLYVSGEVLMRDGDVSKEFQDDGSREGA